MRIAFLAGSLVIACSLLPGCAKPAEEPTPLIVEKDYSAPLPPGAIGLRKITDPSRIPDFSPAYHLQLGLDRAAERSLHYLAKPSSRKYFPYGPNGEITHQRVVRSLEVFRQTLAQAAGPNPLDSLIRRRFEVWESIGCDGQGTVLFTGYYLSLIHISEPTRPY